MQRGGVFSKHILRHGCIECQGVEGNAGVTVSRIVTLLHPVPGRGIRAGEANSGREGTVAAWEIEI